MERSTSKKYGQCSGYLNDFAECNSCGKCERCNDQRRDYLNDGSQICDSCYKRMEQITLNESKPNFKFEGQRRDYSNGFQICKLRIMASNGFKLNLKFKRCKGICNQKTVYLNKFNECDSCEKCKR